MKVGLMAVVMDIGTHWNELSMPNCRHQVVWLRNVLVEAFPGGWNPSMSNATHKDNLDENERRLTMKLIGGCYLVWGGGLICVMVFWRYYGRYFGTFGHRTGWPVLGNSTALFHVVAWGKILSRIRMVCWNEANWRGFLKCTYHQLITLRFDTDMEELNARAIMAYPFDGRNFVT